MWPHGNLNQKVMDFCNYYNHMVCEIARFCFCQESIMHCFSRNMILSLICGCAFMGWLSGNMSLILCHMFLSFHRVDGSVMYSDDDCSCWWQNDVNKCSPATPVYSSCSCGFNVFVVFVLLVDSTPKIFRQ